VIIGIIILIISILILFCIYQVDQVSINASSNTNFEDFSFIKIIWPDVTVFSLGAVLLIFTLFFSLIKKLLERYNKTSSWLYDVVLNSLIIMIVISFLISFVKRSFIILFTFVATGTENILAILILLLMILLTTAVSVYIVFLKILKIQILRPLYYFNLKFKEKINFLIFVVLDIYGNIFITFLQKYYGFLILIYIGMVSLLLWGIGYNAMIVINVCTMTLGLGGITIYQISKDLFNCFVFQIKDNDIILSKYKAKYKDSGIGRLLYPRFETFEFNYPEPLFLDPWISSIFKNLEKMPWRAVANTASKAGMVTGVIAFVGVGIKTGYDYLLNNQVTTNETRADVIKTENRLKLIDKEDQAHARKMEREVEASIVMEQEKRASATAMEQEKRASATAMEQEKRTSAMIIEQEKRTSAMIIEQEKRTSAMIREQEKRATLDKKMELEILKQQGRTPYSSPSLGEKKPEEVD
jgi:hypothetical protein